MESIKSFISKWLAKIAPQPEVVRVSTRKEYMLKDGPTKTRVRTYVAICFAVIALLFLTMTAVKTVQTPIYELPTLVILNQEITNPDESLFRDITGRNDHNEAYQKAQKDFQTFTEKL